jgi:hypothetical protein
LKAIDSNKAKVLTDKILSIDLIATIDPKGEMDLKGNPKIAKVLD